MTVPRSLLAVNQNGGVSASCFFFWGNLRNDGGTDGATRMYLSALLIMSRCAARPPAAHLYVSFHINGHICVFTVHTARAQGVCMCTVMTLTCGFGLAVRQFFTALPAAPGGPLAPLPLIRGMNALERRQKRAVHKPRVR